MRIESNKSGSDLGSVSASKKADVSSAVKDTATKIGQVAKLPIPKPTAQAVILKDVRGLFKTIQKNWDAMYPSEIAEKIVALEEKVGLLEGTSKAIEKVKRAAEDLTFQFIFPIVSTLKSNTPFSFAKTVEGLAKQVFQNQSVAPAKEGLNAEQMGEVMRYATRSGG